jgi:sec-independent protein translocase protein TatB
MQRPLARLPASASALANRASCTCGPGRRFSPRQASSGYRAVYAGVYHKHMGVDMIFIFLLALILFGPKRLPQIAREVGKFMAEFKRASNDFKYQLQAEIDKANAPAQQQSSLASPSAQPSTPTSPTAGVVLPPAPDSQPGAAHAESEHERLMRTARLAFEAQNFTLRPPEPPPIAHRAPAPPQTAGDPTAADHAENPSCAPTGPVPTHPAADSASNSAVQQR